MNREPRFDTALLRQKARSVLHVAAEKGHDALVLGAFGCGYFRNPPEIVARTFSELLKEEFANIFSAVVFAIPGEANAQEFIQFFPLADRKDLETRLEKMLHVEIIAHSPASREMAKAPQP